MKYLVQFSSFPKNNFKKGLIDLWIIKNNLIKRKIILSTILISIIFLVLINSGEANAETMKEHVILPPLKQISLGIEPNEVTCKENYVLALKKNGNNPACFKSIHIEKLEQRGWIKADNPNFINGKKTHDGGHMMSLSTDIDQISIFEQKDKLQQMDFTEIENICNQNVDCYLIYLGKIKELNEGDFYFDRFDEIINIFEKNSSYCHAPAHHLGHHFAEQFDDLKTGLEHADSRCGGAIYHAVWQKFLSTLNEIEIEKLDFKNLCPVNPNNSFSREHLECLHGLGHGVTIYHNFDVFSALQHCDKLDLGLEQHTCAKGVFMENGQEVFAKTGLGTFDATDIFYPCNSVDSKYAPACYNYQSSYIASFGPPGVENAFFVCDMIEPEEFVKYCYWGSGRQFALKTFDHIDRTYDLCKNGQKQYQTYCMQVMASVAVDHRNLDLGFDYCQAYSDQFKDNCYQMIGKWIYWLYDNEDERIRECSKSETQEYAESCINADPSNWEFT